MTIDQHQFTLEEISAASENMAGYCLACRAWHDGCEPDARNYKCEECGQLEVYGAEVIALMGLLK